MLLVLPDEVKLAHAWKLFDSKAHQNNSALPADLNSFTISSSSFLANGCAAQKITLFTYKTFFPALTMKGLLKHNIIKVASETFAEEVTCHFCAVCVQLNTCLLSKLHSSRMLKEEQQHGYSNPLFPCLTVAYSMANFSTLLIEVH